MCRVCWESLSHIPAKRQRILWHLDSHGQINDAVGLQPIHTPDMFIYINKDLFQKIALHIYGSVLLCTVVYLNMIFY